MDTYTVTTNDGVNLGEHSYKQIRSGFELNHDISPDVSWSEVLILIPSGQSVGIEEFFRMVRDTQPDIYKPEIEPTTTNDGPAKLRSIDVFLNLDFQWYEGSGGVDVYDSGGNCIERLDLNQLNDLIQRGILPADHSITGFCILERYIGRDGEDVMKYGESVTEILHLKLSEVIEKIKQENSMPYESTYEYHANKANYYLSERPNRWEKEAAIHFLAMANIKNDEIELLLLSGIYFFRDEDYASAIASFKRLSKIDIDENNEKLLFEGALFLLASYKIIGSLDEKTNILHLLHGFSDNVFGNDRFQSIIDTEIYDIPFVSLCLEEEAVRRFPNNPRYWLSYAEELIRNDFFEEGMEAYNKLVALKPQSIVCWYHYMIDSDACGFIQKSASACLKCIELLPEVWCYLRKEDMRYQNKFNALLRDFHQATEKTHHIIEKQLRMLSDERTSKSGGIMDLCSEGAAFNVFVDIKRFFEKHVLGASCMIQPNIQSNLAALEELATKYTLSQVVEA